ncbi:MAG: aminopeptidase N C-terminal domain-containing protein, partial [Pseudomonadota bacterium]
VMAKNQGVITETVSAYHNADNMTDRFNALATVVHHLTDKHQQEKLLHDFYDRYHDNHIILDKWFSVQAMKPGKSGVAAVRRLMKHPDFTLRNPNRLRSVIAVFAMANPSGFNVENGAGYRLVADLVKTLDRINSQVAARLLTAFRSYKMLEPNRRRMAKDALEGIRQGDLSRDVTDILSRTLAD